MKLKELRAALDNMAQAHDDAEVVVEGTEWPEIDISYYNDDPEGFLKGVVVLRQKFWE